jgi:hypothetical protein
MKYLVCAAAALALSAGAAGAADTRFKPIDTEKLLVKPSRTAAQLSAATINLVGQTAANQVESDGFIKTINNLFGFRRETTMPIQAGPSPLPTPGLFRSTHYKNFNTPVMPKSMPSRR